MEVIDSREISLGDEANDDDQLGQRIAPLQSSQIRCQFPVLAWPPEFFVI